MKLIVRFSLFLFSITYAQNYKQNIDSSSLYYPLQVGNIWHFDEYDYAGATGYRQSKVIAKIDSITIIDGKKYSVINYSGLVWLNPGIWQTRIIARFDSATGNYYQYDSYLSKEELFDSTQCNVAGTYSWGQLSLSVNDIIFGTETHSRIVVRNIYEYDKRSIGFGNTYSKRTGFREFIYI